MVIIFKNQNRFNYFIHVKISLGILPTDINGFMKKFLDQFLLNLKKYYKFIVLLMLIIICFHLLHLIIDNKGLSSKEQYNFNKTFSSNEHGKNYIHPINDRGKILWIDSYGESIFRSNLKFRHWSQLEALKRFYRSDEIEIYKGDKVGLVTDQGAILFDTKYDSIEEVRTDTLSYYLISKKIFGKMYYGIAFEENQWILPLQRDKKFIIDIEKPGFIQIDKKGQVQMELGKGLTIEPYKTPSYEAFKSERTNTQMVVKTFDDKEVFRADVAIADDNIPIFTFFLDDKIGVANNQGQVVLPNYFKNVIISEPNRMYIYQGKQVGLAEHSGQILLPPIYDSIDPSSTGYIRVQYNGKYGVYSIEDDKLMLLPLFDYVKTEEPNIKNQGYAIVGKDGVYNSSGEYVNGKFAIYRVKYPEMFITSFIFDEIKLFEGGFAAVRQGDNWGFINEKGVLLGDIKYKKVTNFKKGLALVMDSEGIWYYINERGNNVRIASKK